MRNLQTTIAMAALLLGLFPSPGRAQGTGGATLTTVCIDAGHGGKDSGCISRDGKSVKEKDIALSIATKLAGKIQAGCPDVRTILTRSDDTFIELGERAAIANRNNAGLFLSVHVNSVDPKLNRNWKQASGFSVHVLGQYNSKNRDMYQANLDLCKRENSVILLEDDYSTKYQGYDPSDPESSILFSLMQNANLEQSLLFAGDVAEALSAGPVRKNRGISQNAFLVLWRTSMPAVLIECGFITNTDDFAAMSSAQGQEKIADCLYQAFTVFKTRYDGSVSAGQPAPVRAAGTEAAGSASQLSGTADPARGTWYGIQILAGSRQLSPADRAFKGHEPVVLPSGKIYKYILGPWDDAAQARSRMAEIRSDFPDAFLVEVKEGTARFIK